MEVTWYCYPLLLLSLLEFETVDSLLRRRLAIYVPSANCLAAEVDSQQSFPYCEAMLIAL